MTQPEYAGGQSLLGSPCCGQHKSARLVACRQGRTPSTFACGCVGHLGPILSAAWGLIPGIQVLPPGRFTSIMAGMGAAREAGGSVPLAPAILGSKRAR